MTAEVKDLEGLLAQYIGPKKKVISSSVQNLLAPGENYFSVVVKLDVVLQDEETGKEENLSAVGKTIHSGDVHEKMKNFGKITYKCEKNFYTEIIPTLQNFLNEKGFTGNFDIFPNLIAYRPNLHGENDEVDDDSILLMENLNINGFSNIDRHVSFDYDGAKLILKDLATFHAVPLAFKLKKRKLFQEKIMKNLTKEESKLPEPKEGEETPKKPNLLGVFLEALETRSDCKLYLPKLKEFLEMVKPKVMWGKLDEREPFSTISHNDLWVNNTMQVSKGGKMVRNKFVDFQVYSYNSPAHDLLFFIWSSVQFPVIKEYFHDLIQHYHRNFLQVLVELGCDCTSFSFDKFEEELKAAAKYEIIHTMHMLKFIFAEKGKFAFDMTKSPGEKSTREVISDELVERSAYIIQICGKKGWL